MTSNNTQNNLMINQPITVKEHTFPTRLIMPPMATAKATTDGFMTDEILAYYDERTKSPHLSFVIIEHSYVTKQGMASPRQISVANDDTIAGLSSLAKKIHDNNTKCIMQINHAGNASKDTQLPVVGPSVLTHPGTKLTCEALTKDQIKGIVEEFRLAALRAQEAGFDGVEIHGAHGYLLNQFYTPKANLRTDEYGGSLQNRIRIHLEIIKAIKSSVHPDFLVMLRFGACDYSSSGGATIQDAVEAAKYFEEAGIDIINVTGGVRGYINPLSTEPGWFKDASTAIKNVVSIPVILAGGITTIAQAEALLQEGCADMIGVGRAILKDPNWVQKEFDSTQQ